MTRRALRLRCPVCGGGGIWRAWGQLVERCPTCGYCFEKEEGYWVGAMIVNLAAAMFLFFVLLVGGFVLFGARLPGAFLWVAGAAMIAVPVAAYPWSKTLWMVLDLRIHPYTSEERPEFRQQR